MAKSLIVTALNAGVSLKTGSGTIEAVNFTKAGTADQVFSLYDAQAFPSTPAAPTFAAPSAGALTGAYLYIVTFVMPWGETIKGTESGSTSPSSQSVNLILPVGPAGTLYRKIYRTQAAGGTGTERFVATVLDNTTTAYNDNASDASIVANAVVPVANTFNADALKFQATGTVNSSFIQGLTGVPFLNGLWQISTGTTSPTVQLIFQ